MTSKLREQILQAASDLFYSQGIKATGVDAIVKTAGTTKMSLYKYFPSKDDLVLAYLRKRGEETRAWLLAGIGTKAGEPGAQLLAVFDLFEELLAIPGFRGCPFINASAEFAVEDNPVHRASIEFYESFQSLLADLARQAGMAEAETLARQLGLLISGAIVAEQMKRDSGAIAFARQAAATLIECASRPSTGRDVGPLS